MVVVPVPGVGVLVLDDDVFKAALERGKAFAPVNGAAHPSVPDPEEALLTAEQLSEKTGVPASWYLEQARKRLVPCHKIGRYVRFTLSEVSEATKVERR